MRKVPGRKSLNFDELATKFVMGLGRVREVIVVYWREKLEAMRRYGGWRNVGGQEDYGYGRVSAGMQKRGGYGQTGLN